MHQPRMDYWTKAPSATRALVDVTRATGESGLDPALRHLVALRASQINQCAYCVDLHYRDALEAGVAPRTLNAVAAWRETSFFDGPTRAALAWTEALTRVDRQGAPDELYAALEEHFDDAQVADLTFAVAAINAWNRVSVGFARGPEAA